MSDIKKNYKIMNKCNGLDAEEIIEKILDSRGIKDVQHFLNPEESDLIPLKQLIGIDKGREIIEKGIDEGKKFGIFYDVDLDGISAGTIGYRYLKNYTNNVECYINQGKAHGLLGQDLSRFKELDILIVVDSLDGDITSYKDIAESGVQIIALDHHLISDKIPYDDYITLISSQRNYDNKELSGSGVVWKFCKYLDEYFMEDFADEYLDLAACGIVGDMCDVSEDSMENRYIISKGLSKICNPAIKKIVGSFPFNSTAISFSLAPLVNAANRVSKNEYAMNAFLADDNKEVLACVKQLKLCKEEQNDEVTSLMPDIIEQSISQIDEKLICVFINPKASISGLIGNKLLEKYQRPILVLNRKEIDGKNYCAGSARAIGVENFNEMCNETLLCKAEGHENAHGAKVLENDFEEFTKRIKDSLKDIVFEVNTLIDVELNFEDINRDLIDKIMEIDRISGKGFRRITARVPNITEYEIGNMSKGKHLTIKPTDYFMFIKWNWSGDFDDMEENSLLEEPISFVGNLESGWLGRKFTLKMICNEINVGENE